MTRTEFNNVFVRTPFFFGLEVFLVGFAVTCLYGLLGGTADSPFWFTEMVDGAFWTGLAFMGASAFTGALSLMHRALSWFHW
jgi:hypothetical protein